MSPMSKPGSRPKSGTDLPRGSGTQPAARWTRRYLYAALGCSLLVSLAAASVLYREYREQLRYWHQKLTRVADINQRLLQDWVKARNEDARRLASSPGAAIVAQSGPLPEAARPRPWQNRLRGELASFATTHGYAGAYVLDGSGRVVAQSIASPALPPALIRELARESRPRTVIIPALPGRASYSQLAFAAPIHYPQPNNRAALIGHVVLLTRAEAIASTLLADTGATVTGETVLLALQANQPVFISPLRHWNNRTGPPAPPLASPGRITLTEKRQLFGAYRDYRGVPVLVASRYLPELGWGLVTKVDRSEALSAFRHTLMLGISIVLLAILVIVSLAVAGLRHQRVQTLQTDLARGKRTEDDLRRSEERFWVALQNSPVVVFNQDQDLRYTWIHNPQPPWSEQDYHGKTDEEVIGVADGSRLTAFKRPVLTTGVGVRKEWSFIYRGEKHDYDISVQPLRNETGAIVGITCASTDITERKRVEARLREYEKVVEGLQEMIVVVDRNYRYLIANHAFLNYRGIQKEDLIGRSVSEVLNPGVFEEVIRPKFDECLKGKVVTFEMKYTYPGLGTRDLFISYFPIEGRDGVDRIACILQDVTDRKRAEKALRDSETRYRLLFERNPAGMFRCTLDGKLLDCNAAFAHILRCSSRQDALQFHISDFCLHPQEMDSTLADMLRKRCWREYEFQGRRKDGTAVWILAKVALLAGENSAPDLLEGAFWDITGRKNAEEALQRSEAQLRDFIENAPYGIFRYSGGHFLNANPTLVQMLGYASEAEVVALDVTSEVFHPTAKSTDLLAISGQQPYFGPIEARWRRRDGSLVLAQLRGRTTGFVEGEKTIEALVEDITHQRALEEHFGQSGRLESLGRLASGVVHDFNNLLLGITLNVEHFIARSGRSEELEQALQAARSAGALTRQLLVFGRKRGQQQQSVNLNDVLIRNQQLVNRLAGEKTYVHLRLGPNLAPVCADPVQVQQVLFNLVANARDAVNGEGQITITTRNVELHKAPADEYFTVAPRPGSYVVLEVSDTGAGISRETLSHIFEPFYTTKEEGSGLGLSTSYSIVAQSSGYMSVRTEPGRGTTLKLYLPRQQQVAAVREAAEA